MKKIVLTGGGTAGHVNPNIALIPALEKEGWKIYYIGSPNGIEKKLISALGMGIEYIGVPSGKIRRYFDVKNVTDMFKVVAGATKAMAVLRKIKPNVVFSKGGFVGVPVVIGAKANRIPVIIHESDMTPGLANKIAIPFSDTVCVNFPETRQYIKKKPCKLTGNPIRGSLFQGEAAKGLRLCGFEQGKPVVLVMGGSLGSVKINETLRKALPRLLNRFQIIHICGKGNKAADLDKTQGYCQFEYSGEDLPHLMAAANLAVSRAGANAIAEFLALKIPHLLIPLSLNASRGDQILNAASFEKQGFSKVLKEEEMTPATLVNAIEELYKTRSGYIAQMEKSKANKGVQSVMEIIRQYQ